MPLDVQNRLNLILPIKGGHQMPLLMLLQGLDAASVSPLHEALRKLANVHFAQFVLLEKGTKLGVFTIFDGDFDAYILSFVEHIGPIFDAILAHIDGAEAVVPVHAHADDFLGFIRAHTSNGLGSFSAYPGRRAFDIVDALKEFRR